ncbi:Protein OSCP1 [Zootermopsis nevadensis]|uniref:Protein OSCP1 n=2 Tax=Zootermopsis nevadensis TaxID=136037 RepID=A0A067R845_ZOONE|nr:Protein OSCP1 [Zootermopsis nevadensis]
MLNEKFLIQLFKPQTVYNKTALRKLFEDLAHASIMRLDEASMDKLYDLMIMAFKYQVLMARQPLELILITLNHVDAIRNFVSAPALQTQIDKTYTMLMQMYAHLSIGEMQNVKYSLLNFLQGHRVRVSVFLRHKVQNTDGTFVIPTSGPVPAGCEIPGCIRSFDPDGIVCQTTHFPAGGEYAAACEPGSTEMHGNRGTDLGCNIYTVPATTDMSPMNTYYGNNNPLENIGAVGNGAKYQDLEADEFLLGKEELNLLMAQLLGSQAEQKQGFGSKEIIRLSLFGLGEEKESNPTLQKEELESKNFIRIDARTRTSTAALEKVYDEMTMQNEELQQDEDKEQDLLDLLDSMM